MGVNVLGIGDAPYTELNSELKNSLTEYYRVENMEDYEQVLKALGFFTHKYGKIDRIDSNNEHWLEMEARLRTDFNIPGTNSETIKDIKLKSLMKKKFVKAGLPVARGKVIETIKDAEKFIKETGYPIVVKPDKGVGAANTYKIKNQEELLKFFDNKTPESYIMEEFIDGEIFTFDGLTDKDGNAVFYTSHTYNEGVMETLNEGKNIYYYSLREIPKDLEEAGFKVLKAFRVIEKFFHFEFFRTRKDNKIIPLEVNMRPPGGFTTDMFNYACDIDIYQEWANIIVNGKISTDYTRKYHTCFISRKYNNRNYRYNHDEIMNTYNDSIVFNRDMPGIFAAVMGDYAYIVRSSDLEKIMEIINYIQQEV
jgi:biotin carboxylase